MREIFGHIHIKSIDNSHSKSFDISDIKVATDISTVHIDTACDNTYEDNKYFILINGKLFTQTSLKEILESIESNGLEKSLNIYDGVYSIFLFDKRRSKIHISRDHFGIYNIFYYQNADSILFSNTLNSFKNSAEFKKEIDRESLGEFLQKGYISAPKTIFKNCFKLLPSTYITIDLKSKKISQTKYWSLIKQYKKEKKALSLSDSINLSKTLLIDSIRKRLDSSKESNSFLSGGFDSSTIVAIGTKEFNCKFNTYTMRINKEADEADIAGEIASLFNSSHTEHKLSIEDFFTTFKTLPEIYPEPFGDRAAFASNILFKEASSKNDFTIFGGDGGDEIFFANSKLDKLNKIAKLPYPLRSLLSKFLSLSGSTKLQKYSQMLSKRYIEDIFELQGDIFSKDELRRLLIGYEATTKTIKNEKKDRSDYLIDNIFVKIIESYLPNSLLPKMGYLGLYYKRSVALPYLDKTLVETLAQIDPSQKRKDGVNKYILKEIAYKYIRREILDRPKKGFSVPIDEFIKREFKKIESEYLSSEILSQNTLFNLHEIKKIKREFLNSDTYYAKQRFWNLLIFQNWYNYWFKEGA
jgi:asparagine synthase (glutamine-hydrolysing)